jgi:L-aspartate oxidase
MGHDLFDPVRLREVRAAMSRHAGVMRNESQLAMAMGALGSLARSTSSAVEANRASWEATNLLTLASAIVSSALARTESRGCHRRSDHPDTDPNWVRHLEVVLDAVGSIDIRPE